MPARLITAADFDLIVFECCRDLVWPLISEFYRRGDERHLVQPIFGEMNKMKLDGSWFDAQTLLERRDALREKLTIEADARAKLNSSRQSTLDALHAAFDPEEAKERLSAWRQVPGLKDDEVFARRLGMDDLSQNEFLLILGTPASALFGDDPKPAWLLDVLACEDENEPLAYPSPVFESYVQRGILSPFLPMIRKFINRLHSGLSSRKELRKKMSISVEHVLELLIAPALQHIEYYHRGASILEVNVRRMLNQLQGETPEERFEFFRTKMQSSTERLNFQKKYPVLTRSLHRTLSFWLEANVEFLERLENDISDIRASFAISESDELSQIEPGSGDVHCHGRSVTTLTFKSGVKVLYKPRSLEIDQHFRSLIDWCTAKGLSPSLKSIRVLSRHDYGWVEFIQARPCESDEEHDLFYERLGALNAILFAVSTVDIHFENLVACGPHPYVIDMETIFHANLDEREIRSASDALARDQRDSVMSIGILPTPVLSGDGDQTFDMSAIGASVNQQAPYNVLGMVNMGRDDINITHIPGWIPSVHNRPSDDDTRPIPSEKIIEGFTSVYRFISAHREFLLAPGGPIEVFSKLRGRLIARNTRFYGTLFLEAIHPDFLRDELDHAMHWDEIWNDVLARPMLERFIPSESVQTRDGDIPFFTTDLDNCSNIRGADGQLVSGVQFTPGYARAENTIREMSPENMQKQIWLMRASLGAVKNYGLKPFQASSLTSHLQLATDVGLEVIRQLGHFRAMASAPQVVSLVTKSESSLGAYSIGSAGADLYEGNAGIALFLGYLGAQTGHDIFTNVARGLIADIFHVLDARKRPWNNLSGFTGAPSLVYVLTHLAALWQDRSLIIEAQKLVESILIVNPGETNLDLLLGPAGCSLAVLPMAKAGDERALRLAKQCADHLIAGDEHGMSRWQKLEIKRGFSHGLAGLAFAFQELASVTGIEIYAEQSRTLLAIEREHLTEERWTDIHNYKGRPQVSWCHGAAGISLGRLGIYRNERSLSVKRDIEIALQEVSEHFAMESQCLCHGGIGNLESLLVAREFPEFDPWTSGLLSRLESVKRDVVENGFRSMMPNQTLGLDLFTGLSGLGYGFLRHANPVEVPSVMLLEPPRLAIPLKSH